MTNEELFADLKQFVTAEIGGLDQKMDRIHRELKEDIHNLDEKLDIIQDHERRLHRLEHRPA